MGLSRLWQQQGKPRLQRGVADPIYGWFTEGTDTADLQEARALLRRCAHSVANASRLNGPWAPGAVRDGRQASAASPDAEVAVALATCS